MVASWKSLIKTVTDGEPVSASVANRPIEDLAQRTEHLKQRQDANDLAEAIYHFEAPLNASTLVGQVVAYDRTTKVFVPALAEVTGVGVDAVVSDRSFAYGIVLVKDTSTSGTIVTGGNRSDFNLTNLTGSSPPLAGQYYLSATTPGRVVKIRPALGIPVCFIDDTGSVNVRPVLNELLDDHRHYKHVLRAEPSAPYIYEVTGWNSIPFQVGETVRIAGDSTRTAICHAWNSAGTPDLLSLKYVVGGPPVATNNFLGLTSGASATMSLLQAPTTDSGGGHHTINNSTTAIEGWLPAASFGSAAPAGAKFGYNINADTKLSQMFPPIPVSSAIVTLDGVIQPTSRVIIDNNGIWWLDNCTQNLPWTHDSLPPPALNLTTCPSTYPTELILWFAKMTTLTDQAVVTSLTAKDSSVIKITNADGDIANKGDLTIDAAFTPLSQNNDEAGALVVKDFVGIGYKRGPVVEKIIVESPLSLSSTLANGQGTVTLSFDEDLASLREGVPELFYNDDVLLESYNGNQFLAFPPNKTSSMKGKISVPVTLSGSFNLKLDIQVIAAHTAGSATMSNLTFSYRKLPRSAPAAAAIALPTTDSVTGTLVLNSGTVSAYNYIGKVIPDNLSVVAAIPVSPGDTVFFTLQRNNADGYSGKIGILALKYIIESA